MKKEQIEALKKLVPGSAQGFGLARIILQPQPNLNFYIRTEGYTFGNTGYYLADKSFHSEEEAKKFFLKNLKTGWPVSSKYKLQVVPKGCADSWKTQKFMGNIPQSDTPDKLEIWDKFCKQYKKDIQDFITAYRLIAASDDKSFDYIKSEIDRYYPEIPIN